MTNQDSKERTPKEVPAITNLQEFKKDRDIRFGVPCSMIAALVTAHGRNIGIFLPNEKIEIKDIEVSNDYAEIEGFIFRQESN
jgi:hypothetical protein